MMLEKDKKIARAEIHDSMKVCYFFMRTIGISYTDEKLSFTKQLKSVCLFACALLSHIALLSGEIVTAVNGLVRTKSLTEFVGGFHNTMYAIMSLVKLLRLWHKRHQIKYLLNELVDLWPVYTDDEEAALVKKSSITALKRSQMFYAVLNEIGVWLFIVTPIITLCYHRLMGQPSQLNFIWPVTYPFDKHEHYICAFGFETYAGVISVSSMVGSDLIFTVVGHISMFLKLLQVKARNLGTKVTSYNAMIDKHDFYEEIVDIIKIHQKLIKFHNNLEDTFSIVILINVLLSSVTICCVVFSIVVIEPWLAISDKFFLCATLAQVGMLCWFADDIYRTSVGVSDAVYECGWYEYYSSVRCRRALLILLIRSQKPLYFTALKFSNVTMNTFTQILTTAYSYFTLIYTMYRRMGI